MPSRDPFARRGLLLCPTVLCLSRTEGRKDEDRRPKTEEGRFKREERKRTITRRHIYIYIYVYVECLGSLCMVSSRNVYVIYIYMIYIFSLSLSLSLARSLGARLLSHAPPRAHTPKFVASSTPVVKFLAEMRSLSTAHLGTLWRACLPETTRSGEMPDHEARALDRGSSVGRQCGGRARVELASSSRRDHGGVCLPCSAVLSSLEQQPLRCRLAPRGPDGHHSDRYDRYDCCATVVPVMTRPCSSSGW